MFLAGDWANRLSEQAAQSSLLACVMSGSKRNRHRQAKQTAGGAQQANAGPPPDPLNITPTTINFNIRRRHQLQTAELAIHNNSDFNFSLKVCCNNNALYRVQPVLSVIEKKSSVTVDIARLPSEHIKTDLLILKYEYEPESSPSIDHDYHRKMGTVFEPPRARFRKIPVRICEPREHKEKMLRAYLQMVGVFTLLVLKRERAQRSLLPAFLLELSSDPY